MDECFEKALLSLQGLSAGDAFGEQFFYSSNRQKIETRILPEGIWSWTDDTAMAISVVEVLCEYGSIHQDALAKRFAERFLADPNRGYGAGACHLLYKIGQGEYWRSLSPNLFGGGSYGNGAAMRIAPLGAYFSGEPEKAKIEAQKSAVVTHYHLEGRAGAMAVAVAASLAGSGKEYSRSEFLESVLQHVLTSEVKSKIEVAMGIEAHQTLEAALELGAGTNISAQDTVPFCLWCAANHLYDYEEALWQTVSAIGDCDTTCAIVGGIVALSCGDVPKHFLERREPLPVLR